MASTPPKEPVIFMCYALYKSLPAGFREEGTQEEEKDEAATKPADLPVSASGE